MVFVQPAGESPAVCDGERTRWPGAEPHGGPPYRPFSDFFCGVGTGELQHHVGAVDAASPRPGCFLVSAQQMGLVVDHPVWDSALFAVRLGRQP